MQIQTQQVRNFRIFSAIHTRPPILRNKIRHPSIVKRIIPFFASLGKKHCACHYYKAAKKIFEISMETLLFLKNFRKKRKIKLFLPQHTTYRTLLPISLSLKKRYNSSMKMFYYILTILSQLSMSSFQITKHGQIFNVYKSAVEIK